MARITIPSVAVQSGTASGNIDLDTNKLLNVGSRTRTVSSSATTQGERTVFADTLSSSVSVTLSGDDTFEGKQVTVVDAQGNAGTNNITVQTQGSQTINGETDVVIDSNFESLVLVSDGENWFVSSRLSGGSSV